LVGNSVLAVYLLRRKEALIWAFNILLTATALYLIELNGLTPPNVLGTITPLFIVYVDSLLLIIMVVMVSVLLDSSTTDLIQENRDYQSKVFNNSKLASLGEMAGGVAHEINNPLTLTLISTSTRRLMRLHEQDRLNSENFQDLSHMILKTVDRITKIVNGLRTISRDSTGNEKEVVIIKDIFEDVLGLCHQRFKNHGFETIIELDHKKFQTKIYGHRV